MPDHGSCRRLVAAGANALPDEVENDGEHDEADHRAGVYLASWVSHAATAKPQQPWLGQWARLGSNQRPPACEAGALPLSYAPGRAPE